MNLAEETQQQYRALTAAAGFVERTDRTVLELSGGDHLSFLQNLSTNDIEKLGAGQGCEAFITTAQGKIVAHVLVFRGPSSVVLETSGGQAETLMAHLDRYIIREDVDLTDHSSTRGQLIVCGREASQHLSALDLPVPDAMYAHQAASIEDVQASVNRVPWSDEAWSIFCPAETLSSIAERLEARGAVRCQSPALEVVRIEQGFPVFGQDISEVNLPQEVDRNDVAISFVKGCYLGQETVARIDAIGHVNRTLCGLRFGEQAAPQVGESVTRDGKALGQITSVTWSPRCRAPLALAYVRRGANEPGARLESPQGEAEVIALPVQDG